MSALQKAIRRKWHGCFIAREKALNNASRLRSDTNNESLQEQYYFFIQRVRLVGSSCHYDKDQRLCLVIQALICKNLSTKTKLLKTALLTNLFNFISNILKFTQLEIEKEQRFFFFFFFFLKSKISTQFIFQHRISDL